MKKNLSKAEIEANIDDYYAECRANEAALKAVVPAADWAAYEAAVYSHGCNGDDFDRRDVLRKKLGMVNFVKYSLAAGLDPDSFELV